MAEKTPGHNVSRHHHITLATGGAQEDYDFHTKVLGMKSVKKTMFYDGQVPIYHLYYGNDMGDESSLVTTFPMRHTGRKATRGSGQVTYLSLSVPQSALPFWAARLENHGFPVTEGERFGERYLFFEHPCGIDYAVVGVDDDIRSPHSRGPVPRDHMIRGTHSVCVSTRDMEEMDEFMQLGWGGTRLAEDGACVRYALGDRQSGAIVDFVVEPDRKAGSWALGEGFVHHMAFQVADHAQQMQIKLWLEGLGYTDCSDVKDRGYFDSIYVRTPSGALFEATVSHPKGFTEDEAPEDLGKTIMTPPQLTQTRDELLAQLETLRD